MPARRQQTGRGQKSKGSSRVAAPPRPARCAVTADLLKVAWPGAMSFIEKKSAKNPGLFKKLKTQLKGRKEVASLAEAPGRKPCRPARRARGRGPPM